MGILDGQVAIVTGASRGIGRGVAIELAREGAAVVLAARTASADEGRRIDGHGIPVGGGLDAVADEIATEGGSASAFPCDLSRLEEIDSLVDAVRQKFGRIDILVNNGMPQHTMTGKFWEQPATVYDDQMTIGPRSYFHAARLCAPVMIGQGAGVIVNLSSPGACIDFYGAAYCVARAASDRMAQALVADLANTGVRAYSLWPSFIRTERLLMAAKGEPVGFDVPEGFDPSTNANSPEMVGRGVARLAADTTEAARVGTVVTLAELAELYDFTDTDGRPAIQHAFIQPMLQELGRIFPRAYEKIAK